MRRFGFLAILILVAQLGVAWVLIQTLLIPNKKPADVGDEMLSQAPMGRGEAVGAQADEARDLPFYYVPPELHRIVVNPAGTKAERAMLVSMQLGLKAFDRGKDPPADITDRLAEETEVLAVLDRYASRMRAIAIACLSHHTIEELDAAHRPALREEMRTCMNDEVLRPAFPAKSASKYALVEDVLFTDFVIQ